MWRACGSGFDIVSQGELERVLLAKGDPSKVVFSGLGKQAQEIKRALEVGIRCFNIESESEIDLINQCAKEMNCVAPVSVRVNPDVDPKTHPYISTGLKENKFGLPFNAAKSVYQKILQCSNLKAIGVDCHIGSQLTQLDPFRDALDRMLGLVDELLTIGVKLRDSIALTEGERQYLSRWRRQEQKPSLTSGEDSLQDHLVIESMWKQALNHL